MVLSIKDPEADRLARAVAAETGELLTQAVVKALRDRLENERRKSRDVESLVADAMEIGRHYVTQPLLDKRTADDIISYDQHGIPR